MCDPVTATITALSVASSAVGVAGQRSAAKAQFQANAAAREAQNEEIAAAASTRAGERVKQARAERASLRVAAGEAGIAGSSFEALLADSVLQEDMDLGLIGQDASFQDRASETRFLSANAAVRNPSALESGLMIAGAGVRGFDAGRRITSRIPSSPLEIPSPSPRGASTGSTRGIP